MKLNFIFTLVAVVCLSLSGINTANAGCNPAGQQGYCNTIQVPTGNNGEFEYEIECEETKSKTAYTGLRCKLIITQE